MGGNKTYWTKKKCQEEALNYETRTKFKKGNGSAYSSSLKNNWMVDICGHMLCGRKPNGYWTKERCKEEALKYIKLKTFKKEKDNIYQIIHKNGWFNDICSHMEKLKKPNNYWNYDTCKSEARKYNNRSLFSKLCGTAYNISRKNNWLDEFFPKDY